MLIKNYILVYLNSKLIVFNSIIFSITILFCSFNFPKEKDLDVPFQGNTIYIVYTQKNCFDCFTRLNECLYSKYGSSEKLFQIKYIFYNLNFVTTKVLLSKLNTSKCFSVVNVTNPKVINQLDNLLDDQKISPYVVIDSNKLLKLIDYKILFDKDGMLNDTVFK